MSEEIKPFTWIFGPSGVFNAYANFAHLNWTLYDIRIRFGQVVPHPEAPVENAPWAIMESSTITLPWGQAKMLRDMLNEAIIKYESANGVINVPTLPT